MSKKSYKNQLEAKIINMIYAETEWSSLNHTQWMNSSAFTRAKSIWKNLPAKRRHVFLSWEVCVYSKCVFA